MLLFIDSETRSAAPIANGLHNYMADPHFAVILVSWAIDDDDARVWDVARESCPKRLLDAVRDESVTLVAHNSTFDRMAFNHTNLFGVRLPSTRWHDTMIQALAHGQPPALASLSTLFGLSGEVGKLAEGKDLINVFCIPSHAAKPAVRFFDADSHPAEWDAFKQYAKQDITSMREVYRRLPKVNCTPEERSIWLVDQAINARGFAVDCELAEAAMQEAAIERKRLSAETQEATDGAVAAATQRDALLKHIADEYGVWLPDLRAATIERRLENPDTPPEVKAILSIRLQASQNAAAKYRTAVRCAYRGRIRNTMLLYGAFRTGRDAGRVFQPQNLKRPAVWKGLEGNELAQAIEDDVAAIKDGTVSLIHGNKTMDVLGSCIRSVIVAPKGKRLVQADLSNIEGRMLAWLAGEEWKVEAFRDFDSGKQRYDNYQLAYSRAMGAAPAAVDKYMRAIGKVMELSMGYAGGVPAFLGYAGLYGLDLQALAESVWAVANDALIRECAGKHAWAEENGYSGGLPEYQYAACEYLKTTWRMAHPQTQKLWRDLEEAFRLATAYPGEAFDVGRLTFKRKGPWLFVRLPSGRCLVYANPVAGGDLSFTGWSRDKKKFTKETTYSGRLAENVTSGSARDVLFRRLPEIEAAGFKVVLRVHDELVCETPDSDEFSAERLVEMMTKPYDWSDGLPLAAAGGVMYRYRKE